MQDHWQPLDFDNRELILLLYTIYNKSTRRLIDHRGDTS